MSLLFLCGTYLNAQVEQFSFGLLNASQELIYKQQSLSPALQNLSINTKQNKRKAVAAAPVLGNIEDRFSLMLNIRAFTQAEPIDDENDALYNLADVTAFSLNLRLFNIRQWAFRIGAGYQDIDYDISQGLQHPDYNALRRDYLLFLGIEKHFQLPIVDIYPGIIVPIVYVGDDEIETDKGQY